MVENVRVSSRVVHAPFHGAPYAARHQVYAEFASWTDIERGRREPIRILFMGFTKKNKMSAPKSQSIFGHHPFSLEVLDFIALARASAHRKLKQFET